MLALTLGLGVWQMQRLTWKTALLAEIDQGEAAAPVPLTTHPKPFQRVVIDGTFLPAAALYGAEVRVLPSGPAMGAHVIAALQRPGAEPVIIDRGWASSDFNPTPPPGHQRIEGYVRPPEHASWLGATDDPVARRFFALDPAAIGNSLGLPHVAPFTIVALGPPGSLPEPVSTLPRPPNDHLTYAITWFSLAAALCVIFTIYVRQTLRSGPLA